MSESSDENSSESEGNESDNEWIDDDNVPLAQLRENRQVARPNLEDRQDGDYDVGNWVETAYRSEWLQDFDKQSGPLIHNAENTPYEIFSSFMTDDLLDLIVLETNHYYS